MDTTRFCAKSLLLASVLTLPACMTIPKGLGDYDARFKELGVASWYGGSFHGRLTANGEIYDQFKMTAAHRLLPLGSVARVTNPENGRAVEVLINDRGPFIRGRIIDLSYAAAEHLGAVRSEEHTSELQSLAYLVCRLLLEKKKNKCRVHHNHTDNT